MSSSVDGFQGLWALPEIICLEILGWVVAIAYADA
jgi:hypothetical protein